MSHPAEVGAPSPSIEPGLTSPELIGKDDRLRPVAQAQLVEDMRDVGLDGRLGQHEAIGDLAVGQPAGHELEDLDLALGQLAEVGMARIGRGRQPIGIAIEETAGDGRREQRVAGGHDPQRGHEIARASRP